MLENYKLYGNGVIKQIKIVNKLQKYDVDYIKKSYDSYGEKRMQMAFLRLGFLVGCIGIPKSILDIGYGNGDFLKACKNIISECYGNDINGYELPQEAEFVENIFEKEYDVICFLMF